MKRSLIALTLSAALLCGGLPAASAATVEESFPILREYPGFSDVDPKAWYADELELCYEIGFMDGYDGKFAPDGNLLVGQMARLATNVYTALTGEAVPSATPKAGENAHWAYSDMAFLRHLGADVPADPDVQATRGDLVEFLSAVVPGEFLSPINSIAALPDTGDPRVLAFCNAGLITGVDGYGTFGADGTLYRCEAAALVARVARTELRVKYQLKALDDLMTAAGVRADAMFFDRGDGTAVTAAAYLKTVADLISGLETECAKAGIEFNWNNTVDGVTFLKYVKDSALSACGVTAKQGTQAFKDFDVQAFYAELFELRGFKPL